MGKLFLFLNNCPLSKNRGAIFKIPENRKFTSMGGNNAQQMKGFYYG